MAEQSKNYMEIYFYWCFGLFFGFFVLVLILNYLKQRREDEEHEDQNNSSNSEVFQTRQRLFILNSLQSIIDKQNEEAVEKLMEGTLKAKRYKPMLNKFKDNCSICLEGYQLSQMVTLLPCWHLFHNDCFSFYAYSNVSHPKCPNCNYNILDTNNNSFEKDNDEVRISVNNHCDETFHESSLLSSLDLPTKSRSRSSIIKSKPDPIEINLPKSPNNVVKRKMKSHFNVLRL